MSKPKRIKQVSTTDSPSEPIEVKVEEALKELKPPEEEALENWRLSPKILQYLYNIIEQHRKERFIILVETMNRLLDVFSQGQYRITITIERSGDIHTQVKSQ